MTVDIKNRGIDYLLEETQTIHQGCTVEGKFYEPLLPSEFQGLARELAKLTAYCEIPIVANGKTLNTHPDTAEWDLVDEDCYVRVRQTGPLLVYNQGAFVQENDAYKFGFGGVVVSRKPLQLNQARNDVLAKLCPVWQRIAARLKVLSVNTAVPAVCAYLMPHE